MKSEVLSVKEKIGYGMGDAASHIIFDNVMLYMMFFYTDIFGIPAGFVGTMFLVARALGCDFRSLAWGCWPIERALAGVNFVRGYCLAHCHSGSSVYWPIARQISV
ncbi:putative carbohydrate transporter [Escherichia coli]|uniref:Putative carbohydrate transporter n=1 Tax=Escherichia coli TaxID=562 RepID=A0A376RBC3_ECOLX|nr:putative carbohydrate transporter [Escherichia coli]